jgi:demethylmenaquinone methyltransferase/2-methoxy-6-polyprenyl-1,4-benzoquinol methylase
MTADRLLDLLSLLALACVGITGLARAVALAARGVWVLPIDRERSVPQGLVDLAFLLGLLAWVYEAIATAVAPDWRLGSGPLWELEVPWSPIRWLGLAVAGTGVSLYVLALRDFGASWRFTTDRERPGELVTTGVFALSRNPVYLALTLLALGVSLALGSAALILLVCAAPLYFQHLIRREERFLAAHCGEAYAKYCADVPRWWRWPRPKALDGHRRPAYKWMYDHLESRVYDLGLCWFLLPFGGERRFRREMTSALDFAPDERVLDLCCGTGSSSAAIRERAGSGCRLVGADLSRGQLAKAARKQACQPIALVETNAACTPFASESFDCVVIPHALHEMPRETRVAVLREAGRVLKRHGRVAVLELDDPPSRIRKILLGAWLLYWLPYPINFENPTRRDMVRHGLQRELATAGFEKIHKVSRYHGTMQVLTGALRSGPVSTGSRSSANVRRRATG